MTPRDVILSDGRRVVAYDTGRPNGHQLTLMWHHGSPQSGVLVEPLVALATARRIRLVSYARPGYRGSMPNVGRDVASGARDVEQVMDALDIDQFTVMGASGGGPHALACAALLPNRVIAAVAIACPAPLTDAFDWYAGMISAGGLRAAEAGREARARYAVTEQFDENSFTAADWAALATDWAALGHDADMAGRAGPDGAVDDDVAFVKPWGFELSAISTPVLLVQGGDDRIIPPSHAQSLLRTIPSAQLWLRPRDGHISVLRGSAVAMDWLLDLSSSQHGARPASAESVA